MENEMRRLFVAAILVASVCAGQRSSAGDHSGNELLADCGATMRRMDGATLDAIDTAKSARCTGFVRGVTSTLDYLVLACLPASVSGGQAVRVVVQALQANPATLQHGDVGLVIKAVLDTWDCPKAKPSKSR
jgi:hypothetical protein